jgi:hypothetical protein
MPRADPGPLPLELRIDPAASPGDTVAALTRLLRALRDRGADDDQPRVVEAGRRPGQATPP